ncbi:MAG: hypothetical protein OEW68_09275 [Gammaproteobacteria bacterium]|nr:hypothetical protein [Gammaproteobacteria bacterium]
MDRLLILPIAVALLAAAASGAAAEPSRYELELGADISFIDASGYETWTDGGPGKLRFDDDNDGFVLSRAFADYKLRMLDTVDARLVAQFFDNGVGSTVDFTEAYLEWRPMTATANRYRVKLGAFYPHMSLENSGPAWSSPYTISSSVLNTWIAEEIRIFGAEVSVSRRPQFLGGAHTFSLQASAFYNNDPAGGLLAWKGWSAHDLQSRFGDKLPLPPLPQIQPGMWFQRQAPFIEPYMEIDDVAGYYASGEWRYGSRLLLRLMHYDNRGDTTGFADGQYAWRTVFDHIGLQVTLPGDIGLIAQWMDGYTLMGPVINGRNVVDAGYYSEFLLLTKAFADHRLSLRYDRFEVSDHDGVPLDDNSEYGDAWTVAYQYEASRFVTLAIEWLQIESYREAWEYFGLEEVETESQFQMSLRLRFGSGP